MITPVRTLEIVTFPITVPVNQPFDVTLSNLDGPVRTVSIQGPPRRGEFVEGVIKLTNDTVPPTVFTSSIPDGATGVLLEDNITIEMSEPVDPSTVNCNPNCGTVVVKDSTGNIIEGDVYLAADGKTIVFAPKYGYEYGTDYTIEINGVKDLGGNAITEYESAFETFNPNVLATIADITNVKAIDKYTSSVDGKNYLVVAGAYGAEDSGLIIVDISDPENPEVKGTTHTFGYDFDVKALPDVTFTDRNGNTVTGDFAVAVGGQVSKIGYLNLLNITDPSTPYIYEYLYISWSPMYSDSAPANVPYAAGQPLGVATLGTYAYVVNLGLGLQAVDLTKVTPPHGDAQKEAILSTYTDPSEDVPSFRGIASLKGKKLLLVTSNHTLTVFSPELNVISKMTDLHLPYDVTGVEAFPIDIDNDGNLGTFEDEDGDNTTSAQENFDLAFVSTNDGVVIVDITKPDAPCKMAIIPTGGLPGNIRVDKERRLAYVMLNSGLGVVSLEDLKPSANCAPSAVMIDADRDGVDDRIISTIPEASGIGIALSDDSSLAYVSKGNEVEVVDLGTESENDFVTVNSPWKKGVEQNLVYANEDVRSDRKVKIWLANATLKGKINYQKLAANFSFKGAHLGSYSYEGAGSLNETVKAAVDENYLSNYVLYQAGIGTGKDTIIGQMKRIITILGLTKEVSEGAQSEAIIYNYDNYDFNYIMDNKQYTESNTFKTPKDIEDWLINKGSPLAYRGIGKITAADNLIPIGSPIIESLPDSGTIRVDNEEMQYTRKTEITSEYYGWSVANLQKQYQGEIYIINDSSTDNLSITGPGVYVANRTNAVDHGSVTDNTNIKVEFKTELSETVGADSDIIPVGSTAAAVAVDDVYTVTVGDETFPCKGKTIDAFTDCQRGKSAKDHNGDSAVYFEVGKLGTLVSKIIHQKCTNNDYPDRLNPAIMLTHIQKEQSLHSLRDADDIEAALNKALGVKVPARGIVVGGSKSMTFSLTEGTFLLDQLIRSIKIARKWYGEPTKEELITPITGNKKKDYYYVSPDSNRNFATGGGVAVKFRIMNRTSQALYKYTPWVTTYPKKECKPRKLPDNSVFNFCGGQSLFVGTWKQYEFDKTQ